MRPTLMLLTVLLSAGCDDTLFGKVEGAGEGEGEGEGGDDWCAVETILQNSCVSCHSGPSGAGNLDLETDPHTAMVGQASSLYDGQILVVAGDSASSLLYHKVANTQESSQGSAMPLPSGLSSAKSATIAAWIDAGATTDCSSGTETGDTGDTGDDTGTVKYHPVGYEAPDQHGLEAKLGVQKCTDCHGDTLEGVGTIESCDACHEAGWRTNCTFCHGDESSGTDGAPPRDIDGVTDPTLISFPLHTKHLTDTAYKDAFACETCHVVPTDVLSSGHVFFEDDTPAVAETDFSGGLSPAGTWDGATCSNLYCHGDGQGDNGEVSVTETIDDCVSCHPHESSGPTEWVNMSGAHNRHLSEGPSFECGDCHKQVVETWEPIKDPTLHVDGSVSVQTVGTITYDETTKSCTGECHYEDHEARWWYDTY